MSEQKTRGRRTRGPKMNGSVPKQWDYIARNVTLYARRGEYGAEEVIAWWFPDSSHPRYQDFKERFRGDRVLVTFPSRRVIKPGDRPTVDLVARGAFIEGMAPDEETFPFPTIPNGYITVTDRDQLEKMKKADWNKREKYRHKPTNRICYLDFSMNALPALINEAHPVYLVGIKRGFYWATTDRTFIELLAEYDGGGGALPDMTFMRTGKVRMVYIDWDKVTPGYQAGKDWHFWTELSPWEALGIDASKVKIPNLETIAAALAEAKRPYEELLAPDKIDELFPSAGDRPWLERAYKENPKKLEQAARYLELQFRAEEENQRASDVAAAQKAQAFTRAWTGAGGGHQALIAPPAVRALVAGVDRDEKPEERKPMTVAEIRSAWTTAFNRCLPGRRDIDGDSIPAWIDIIIPRAHALDFRVPAELPEDVRAVVQFFRNIEFPLGLRWELFCGIRRQFQSYSEEQVEPIRDFLERDDEFAEDELEEFTAGITDAHRVDAWHQLLEAIPALRAGKERVWGAAALLVKFDRLPMAASKLGRDEIKRLAEEAFAMMKRPLGPRTGPKLIRAIEEVGRQPAALPAPTTATEG